MRAKEPVEQGWVERDGVRIHFEIFGDGEETMVFLPPWSIVHSRVYKGMIPYFSDRYRCIAFDGRGNGKSDRPANIEDYTLDAFFADALAVMDATDADRAILVGLSFAGILAAAIAAYHPHRAKAAILLGTAASIGPGYPYMTPQHFLTKQDTRPGTSTTRTSGSATIRPSRIISSARFSASRIRRSRSRTPWTGRQKPPERFSPRRSKRVPFRHAWTSARRCTGRSRAPFS